MASELHTTLIALGRELAAAGHVQASGGNLSVRAGEQVWITARGAVLGALVAADDLVEMDLEGNVRGAGKPSSEWRMHLAAYRARPEARWVLHTHSPHAVALGYVEGPLGPLTPDHYLAHGRRVARVPLITPTTARLADAVGEALQGAVVVLLAKHGVLVTGPDVERARLRLLLLEESARLRLMILAAGARGERIKGLSRKAMRELDEITGGRYQFD